MKFNRVDALIVEEFSINREVVNCFCFVLLVELNIYFIFFRNERIELLIKSQLWLSFVTAIPFSQYQSRISLKVSKLLDQLLQIMLLHQQSRITCSRSPLP